MVTLSNEDAPFNFTGVLQHSNDLMNGTDITPRPPAPM